MGGADFDLLVTDNAIIKSQTETVLLYSLPMTFLLSAVRLGIYQKLLSVHLINQVLCGILPFCGQRLQLTVSYKDGGVCLCMTSSKCIVFAICLQFKFLSGF